ncbi:MAG TPA: TonB-dependent receptor, partial [Taishania sp.]|nr:TonB-dependent receptor [Taishania sp.]
MKYNILLFFLLLVFHSISQEVTLTGYCINKQKNGVTDVMILVKGNPNPVFTDNEGKYSITGKVNDTLHIQYNLIGETEKYYQTFFIQDEHATTIPTIIINKEIKAKDLQEHTVIYNIDKPFELTPIKPRDWQTIPLQTPEHVLVFTTAARSSNELTSNYNVRGGNYDENLVYVNGFQIYRPFLTRAGQQEGMSFINSALVESLNFSAGGFDAQYGDKMSSVLDIKYRNPEKFRGSIMASMLGVEGHIEQRLGKQERFSYMLGARYRSNGYFLNSLPTKGAYNPVFWDAQILTNYLISENWTWSLIGHISNNNYSFTPQTAQTNFGPSNNAFALMIYFDGKEDTRFGTMMGGTKFGYVSNDSKTKLNFFATAFHSDEREYFDVQGQYFINKLETDPSKEE